MKAAGIVILVLLAVFLIATIALVLIVTHGFTAGDDDDEHKTDKTFTIDLPPIEVEIPKERKNKK